MIGKLIKNLKILVIKTGGIETVLKGVGVAVRGAAAARENGGTRDDLDGRICAGAGVVAGLSAKRAGV